MRAPFVRRAAAMTFAVLAVCGLSAAAGTSADAAGGALQNLAAPPAVDFRPACTSAPKPGVAACLTLIRTDVPQRPQAQLAPHQAPVGSGYGPADLQNAYLLPSANAGTGQTVAIVDAFDYPSAEADLATYRSDWGLPPCTSASGCFRKLNQDGQAGPLPAPAGGTGWATEEALDIQMVSAVCPNCNIVLVEANSPEVTDLGTAVNSAVAMGVRYVSNSYGAPEYAGESADEAAYYDHPGVAVTVSSGDSGYQVQFPSSSPHVVSVGGTSLTTDTNARGWTETAWTGAGSGCSDSQAKPSWQTDSGCANRTNTDVSAVADPATGVAVYDTYDRHGWLQVGGTSVAAPIIAGIYPLVGTPPLAGSYPAGYLYAHAASLNDVTSGSNGSCSPAYLCTAGPGYDGPTGLGTPSGIAAFGAPSGNIITVANPGDQAVRQDVGFTLQMRATDTAPGESLGYSATGLPDGLAIDATSGLISGTPTGVGDGVVTVTATDGTGASGFAKFTVRVASVISFAGPGPQASYVGQPVRLSVAASDAVAGRTLTYSAATLPAGLSLDSGSGLVSGVPVGGYTKAVVTALDSAGRSNDDPFIWYVAPAQATARSGAIGLGRDCLDSRSGTAVVSSCNRTASQTWTVEPDGTVRAPGGCLTAAAAVTLSACTGDAAQQWRIASFGELVNPASGSCLTGSSGQVSLAACTAADAQRWSAPPGPIVSAVTGMCADAGSGTTDHVQVWYCGSGDAQAWTVQPDGTVRVGHDCLSVAGSVRLGRCDGTLAQQWRIAVDGAIVQQASGNCLADPGDNPVVGTRLAVEPCGAATGQLWHVE